ncbi:MAG: HAD-IIIC family phosphatase, partial [Clostridia bacterium]|nr:HAD-IIIC family phosphatase [Clostridia bacterium]
MDVSKIKLIIWDLDDTFWTGTISEQTVAPRKEACDLVLMCAKKGIVNSICSKNDKEPCIEKLREWDMDKYFVFSSINWQPKGQRIKDTIAAMNLRAPNVLFIDDNPQNLEEAKYFSPEIMTALPDKIGEL